MTETERRKPLQQNSLLDAPALKGWFERSGRLYEQRVRDLSLLRRLSDSISLDLDVEKALQFILDILLDELNITNGSIMLFDGDTERLVLRCARGQGQESKNPCDGKDFLEPIRLRMGEGIAGTVLQSAKPVLIDDAQTDPRFLGHSNQAVRVGSLLCLPLIIRGNTVGVINLSHVEKNFFTQGDLHGLTVVANQIAMLLDNAENYKRIRVANLELEAKVKERTRHLEEANRELKQTRSSLIQSERLKALGQMASGVAHDFNNTLAGIIGNTQLMLAEVAEGRIRERLEAVELAARDGAATVKRIQEFSRIKRTTELEPLNLNDLISDVIKITSPLWKDQVQKQGKTVDLITRLGEVQPTAGNAAELREVLTNMIINALDAMPDGGEIIISTWMEDDSVFLVVSDTGTGIAPEVKDRLFDPFFTTKGPGNSGLGLSVAYGIIRRHNGKIRIESVPGKGATLIIQLPLCAEPVQTRRQGEEIKETDSARILLIDDDKFVRNVLVSMLERAGHEVVAFEGGEEGIEVFKSKPFDLVFTDLGMPGLSGWEVAAAIKELSPKTPVVLITGWGKELDEGETINKGVDFLLPKPFELAAVQNMVAAALELAN